MTTTPAHLTAEDRLEIIDLLHRYMFVLDGGESHGYGDGYADLYTEDGTFGDGPPGREGLAIAAGRTPDGDVRSIRKRGPQNALHLNVGEVIVPAPGGARGTSYLLMIDGPGGQVYWAGWYEDEYRKTERGWRFKSRILVTGEAAGLPTNAGEIRREIERMALEALGPRDAPLDSESPGIARDPLNWVDGKL